MLVAFDSTGALAFATFLGTTSTDGVNGMAVAPDGTLAATGSCSLNLATNPVNAYQSTRPGAGDGWFIQIADALEGSANAPSIQTASLAPWTVGVPVTGRTGMTLTATSNAGPCTWSVSSGQLPPGVTLGTDGALSGAPTSDWTYQFTVQARDTYGIRGRKQFTWVVNPAMSVTTASLPDWTRTIPFSQTVTGTGGTGTLTWRVSAGSLPAGLGMDTSGQIAGTPSGTGTSNFTVEASDVNGGTATRDFTVKIAQVPAIGTAAPPQWTEGRPYNFTFASTGGTGALTWAVTAGDLPVATAIDAAAGKLTGLAKSAGDFAFTVRATDIRGAFGERSFQVHLNAAPVIATVNLPFAVVGRAYTSQLVATGGTPPSSWNLEAGLLPVGIGLTAQTGRIAGTPTAPTAGQLTLSYGDAAGAVAQRPIYFECAELLDLTTRKALTPFVVTVSGAKRSLRCLELVGGSLLDVSVAGGGAAGQGPNVRFYAADGSEVDVSASLKVTPKGAKLKKLLVPSTGRWFLAVEAASGFQGTMKVTTTLTPPARWTATTAVDGDAAPVALPFNAAPGSTIVVSVKPAKKSPAKPAIVALTGPDGADLLAGGLVKTKGSTVTFASKVPLAGGAHVLTLGGLPGTAGDVVWTVTLKAPKTFEFEMPDVPAGDAE
jgi:hypothetical protein